MCVLHCPQCDSQETVEVNDKAAEDQSQQNLSSFSSSLLNALMYTQITHTAKVKTHSARCSMHIAFKIIHDISWKGKIFQ